MCTISRPRDLHAQSTYIYELWCCNAWQWVIYCHDCIARRMEDILDEVASASNRRQHIEILEWVMLCIYEHWKVFKTFSAGLYGVLLVHLHDYFTVVKLYFFMILGIHLRIMCLTPSMWKVQNGQSTVNKITVLGDDLLVTTWAIYFACWPVLSS